MVASGFGASSGAAAVAVDGVAGAAEWTGSLAKPSAINNIPTRIAGDGPREAIIASATFAQYIIVLPFPRG